MTMHCKAGLGEDACHGRDKYSTYLTVLLIQSNQKYIRAGPLTLGHHLPSTHLQIILRCEPDIGRRGCISEGRSGVELVLGVHSEPRL